MIAIGHSAERRIVAVVGGLVRGRKALRTAAATSAPYTGRERLSRRRGGESQAGQKVSVGGSLPVSR